MVFPDDLVGELRQEFSDDAEIQKALNKADSVRVFKHLRQQNGFLLEPAQVLQDLETLSINELISKYQTLSKRRQLYLTCDQAFITSYVSR